MLRFKGGQTAKVPPPWARAMVAVQHRYNVCTACTIMQLGRQTDCMVIVLAPVVRLLDFNMYAWASGRAWAVSIFLANRQVPGSNPPEDTGNSCASDRLWLLLRHLQPALLQIIPGISSGSQREAPPRMSRGGIPCLGVSHFPVDKAVGIEPASGLWLQTGPCMPYGLWLWVATHIYIFIKYVV